MAELEIRRGNLFNSKEISQINTMILHCVSADYALGAGFALEIEKKFHIRNILKQIGSYNYPDCIAVGNVLNIVTKGAYWTKPTYETFKAALEMARNYCISNNVTTLVMPKIGAGLDRLDWKRCVEYINTILVNSGIYCIVYVLK